MVVRAVLAGAGLGLDLDRLAVPRRDRRAPTLGLVYTLCAARTLRVLSAGGHEAVTAAEPPGVQSLGEIRRKAVIVSEAGEFLELARERRFDGHRLAALRDFLLGLGSVFSGFSITSIDDPTDITRLADKFIPFLETLAKFTPTTFDDQALAWLHSALQNPTVAEIIFKLFFESDLDEDSDDDELLDALQSAARAAAA